MDSATLGERDFMEPMTTIPEYIDRILQLQKTYNESVNDPSNVECRQLLEKLVERWKSLGGGTFSSGTNNVYFTDGDVSRGATNFPKIPWVRLTDRTKSKSATRGYYLVLLFAAGGDKCFLSINQGSDGDEDKGKTKRIKQRVNKIQTLIKIDPSRCLAIDLNSSGRASNYKNGHITGFEFSQDAIPDETDFISKTKALLTELAFIYDNEELIEMNETEIEPQNNGIASSAAVLAESLNWSLDKTEELLEAFSGQKKQIILGGPPGTGKTFAAEKIANFLVGNPDYVEVVQFHPSYGYEDFVEGLRPSPLPNGGFEFKRSPGVIPKLSALIDGDEDTEGDDHARVLIIDEINRANIARVFGELMYLLEYRDKSLRLMLDGREFSLPSNLIIIGTMNTADRSTRSLDIAMRRRFSFFELLPDVEILKKFYQDPSNKNELGQELFNGFETLNNKLRNDLDKHFMVGHSYFMNTEMNAKRLRTTWSQEVCPLIEEYFFDNDDRTAEYSFNSFWPSV